MRYAIYGLAFADASVQVYDAGTATPSPIYAAQTGGSVIATGIIVADSYGRVVFWVDDVTYPVVSYFDLVITKTGQTTSLLYGVWAFFNIAQAAVATPPANLSLSPMPKLQFFANNGQPLAGGYLYTAGAGTPATPKATYSDSVGTLNTNPVLLDSAGRCSLWLNGFYFMELWTGDKNVAGSTLLWTQDNVSSHAAPSSAIGGQDWGTAAPTTGTWPLGWIRWNTAPVAGGNAFWICTVAGTPGTWKEGGLINA